MAVSDLLSFAKAGQTVAKQFTHKGKSGRVYESDHEITQQEREQIDRYDAEVELPKRKPAKKTLQTAAKPKATFDYSNTLADQKKAAKRGTGDLRKLDRETASTKGKGFLGRTMETVQETALQAEGLRTGNPNYDPSMDYATDFGRKAPPESRRNFDPKVNRAKDPISNSLPALVATQLVQKAPGMAAAALNTLGGGPQMSRETREGVNQSPIAAFGKYLIPGVGGVAASVDTAKGAVEALDALGKGDASKAMMELAGNVLLPASLHGAANYAIPALVKAWKGFRATGSADDFLRAADRVGLDPQDARALVDVPEMPKVPEAPKVETPVVETPKVETPPTSQGISHAEVDDLRKDMGWQPRNPTESKPDDILNTESKKFEGREHSIASRVLDPKDAKEVLDDAESVALGKRLKTLKQEMLDAKAKNDVDAFDNADAEAQAIANALDASGTNQGRAFRARRFLFDGQEDSWTLNRRAVKANGGQPLDAKKQGELDKVIADLESANATLTKERDAAVKQLDLFKEAKASKSSSGRTGAKTAQQKRQSALASLKRLGIEVSENVDGATPSGGGMKSKQSGAINIPEGQSEKVATAVRSLVRSYADEGIENWDQLLGRLQKDLPGIGEEQALWILSGKYKVAKLEADVSRMKTNKFLRDIQQDAVYKGKSVLGKVMQNAGEIFNTGSRTMQTTLDNSLALIQGKNVLMSRPGTWLKAVGNSFKAMATKDPIGFARKHAAEIENHPLYARAVKAKLGLSDVDGTFSKQEEFFAGNLQNLVPGLSHSKAAATVLGNTMRFDLFRKMAANLPTDAPAEAYEDIARYVNVITGKGDGEIAQWLGGKFAGNVAYAPRFYLSKWQHNLGQPIWAAKTAAGRKEAMKGYAAQMAMYGTALAATEAFGWDVDLDPRSATFGKATRGDTSFDLFYQQSEGVRVLTQLAWGRTSQKGNYTAPGEYGAYSPGQYIDSKASPGLKMAKMALTGKTFDFNEWKTRDVKPSDFWGSYIPLSIQEMYKNRDKPGTFVPSFMGGNIDKSKAKDTDAKKPPALPTDPAVRGVEEIIRRAAGR